MRVIAATSIWMTLALLASSCARAGTDAQQHGQPAAPEFTQRSQDDWINSQPLSLAGLRGKVVLVDFWTFECWNCYRSFPWLNAVHDTFAEQPFQIIGVHSPEFERERDRRRVAAKVREFRLEHPVMIDNDFSYWRAMGNRYWPSFYLIDKQGRLRYHFAGETHAGDARAQAIERRIAELIAE
jgi:thiol-disulfide isomerase/thioredoxin